MKETFEKDFLLTYVKFPKWLAFVFLGLSPSLLICIKINFNLIALPILAGVIDMLFFITYFCNRKFYGNKISIQQEKIVLLNAKGKEVFSVTFENIILETKMVIYNGSGLASVRHQSLIIYDKNDVPEHISDEIIEHSSYRNEKNIVFIQDPTLMLEIEKIFRV